MIKTDRLPQQVSSLVGGFKGIPRIMLHLLYNLRIL